MSHFIVTYFVFYLSTIPYALFYHQFFDRMDTFKKSLLMMLPFTLVFLGIYYCSLLFPSELIGMSVKTLLTGFLLVLYFAKSFRISIRSSFIAICIINVIVIFSQLLMSVFFDLSGATNYLTAAHNPFYETIIEVTCSVVECIVLVILNHFYHSRKEVFHLPFRYVVIGTFSLVALSIQGAILLYLNTSTQRLSSLSMIAVCSISLVTALLPVALILDNNKMRHRLQTMPVILSMNEHLNIQLNYLQNQIEYADKAEADLKQYKHTADLSKSIDDVFQSHQKYEEVLFTDNPVINTLLMYYDDEFNRKKIAHRFEIKCSTYTFLPDSMMIYCLSGLLNSTEASLVLSMMKNANILYIAIETEKYSRREINILASTLQKLNPTIEVDCISADSNKPRHLTLCLTDLSGSNTASVM